MNRSAAPAQARAGPASELVEPMAARLHAPTLLTGEPVLFHRRWAVAHAEGPPRGDHEGGDQLCVVTAS